MIVEKTYKENLFLHILYFTLETFYHSAYPNYPKDVEREILKFLDLLDKYIDYHYKDYDILDEVFLRKITFKKLKKNKS